MTERQKDGQAENSIPPQTTFAGYNNFETFNQINTLNEKHCEKTFGLRLGLTQTRLYSHSAWREEVEGMHYVCSEAIAQLICTFIFTCAKTAFLMMQPIH